MTVYEYDLTVLDDRNEIYKRFERIPLSYEEFNATMEFLTENLSKEWLVLLNTKIGEIVFPNKISIGKSCFNTIGIIQLIDIGRRLMLLSQICDLQKHYIKKLNDPSFQRVSILQEIYAAGSYREQGYYVEVEPSNMRIGKSGKTGKCDFSVKYKNEQV